MAKSKKMIPGKTCGRRIGKKPCKLGYRRGGQVGQRFRKRLRTS